jgi:hypothetical protein
MMNVSPSPHPTFDGSDLAVLREVDPMTATPPFGTRLILSNNTAQWIARLWLKAWSGRDLPKLTELYADGCELSSPLVAIVMAEPSGRLRGKDRIIHFWEALFAREERLASDFFTVYRGIRTVIISYRSLLGKNALEQLEFDDAGRIIRSTSSFDQIA